MRAGDCRELCRNASESLIYGRCQTSVKSLYYWFSAQLWMTDFFRIGVSHLSGASQTFSRKPWEVRHLTSWPLAAPCTSCWAKAPLSSLSRSFWACTDMSFCLRWRCHWIGWLVSRGLLTTATTMQTSCDLTQKARSEWLHGRHNTHHGNHSLATLLLMISMRTFNW